MSTPFRPAPVLPAMSVYSFHNDSPPFAISAANEAGPEPEPLSLEDGRAKSPQQAGMSTSAPSQTQQEIRSRDFYPDPVASNRGSGPPHHRTRTNSDDEHMSSSRSRRLLTGYLLGNPHAESRPESPNEIEVNVRNPTPPEENDTFHEGPLDSPPVSVAREEDDEADSTIKRLAQMRINGNKPRQDSRVRDRETGYDRLNGLNDGEADLDESAPQATGNGSEAFLRGEAGPSGEYHFPKHRLRTTMKDESKIPLVIVACGSFSPPTYLHLRMFEMAKDEIVESQTYEIMAGYYSPVSSHYKKSGLAPAFDRVRMCELAVEHTSTWLMVDPWEAGQPEYQRTAVVLEHFDEMLNGEGRGVVMSDGRKRKFKVMLLAGGDLVESFGQPGVWSEPDLHIILSRFGCLIVERAGSDVWAFLLSHDILYHHRRNVIVIKQLIYNDISSTKVRLFVRRGMSIKYLLPNSVIQYIYDHKLYKESDVKSVTA